MEATATVSSAGPSTTGSSTIADLIQRTAAEHAEHPAVRFKRGGAWHDVSYAELATIVQEIGLGLIDLGIEPGERVCILANTRPEWSYADLAATAAGAVVVPIYQTNSPEECLWVISDSGASAIICEDEEQLAKIAAIRDQLPHLRTVIVIDPTVDEASSEAAANGAPSAAEALQAITLEQVRERGRSRSVEELDARRAAVRPEDPYTFIYTSGTTGPPKGCVLTHGNYRAIVNMIGDAGEITDDEVVYLYLPLAHSFALLVQLAVFDLGGTLAYFGGDTKQIVPELDRLLGTLALLGRLGLDRAVRERVDLLEHARHRRQVCGLDLHQLGHDLLGVAAEVGERAAEVEDGELDQQRKGVSERQVEVDDLVVGDLAGIADHVDDRPIVAVGEHAALRWAGRARGVDERVWVLGAHRRAARVELLRRA